jgi:hypothetical protein
MKISTNQKNTLLRKIKLARLFLSVQFLLLMTGCGTIHFTQGPQAPASIEHSTLHHSAFMEIIEINSPLNPREVCGAKNWQQVTVEKSFWNGFLPTLILNPPFINLYGVWTVTTVCVE